MVKDQESKGRWAARLRSGGGQPVDVVAIDHFQIPHFIQCKYGAKIAKKEKEAFQQLCEENSVEGLLAIPGELPGSVEYKVLW